MSRADLNRLEARLAQCELDIDDALIDRDFAVVSSRAQEILRLEVLISDAKEELEE